MPFHFDLTTVNELDSDHDPVVADSTVVMPALLNSDWINEVDWDAAVHELHQSVDPRPRIDDIDALEAAAADFSHQVLNAVRKHTHRIPNNNPDPRIIPIEPRQLIKAKSTVRKLWQRFRHPRIGAVYQRFKSLVRRLLRAHRKEAWENTLANVNLQKNKP